MNAKNLWLVLRVGIAFALLYYVLSRNGNWTAARLLLSTVWLLPFLFAQTIVGAAVESRRMGVLFGSQGMDVPFWYGYQLTAIAAFFSLCIPGGTGGDVMKLYYLTMRHRGKGVEVATVLLIDRVVAMFALLGLLLMLALAEGTLMWHQPVVRILILGAAGLMAALPCFAIAVWSGHIRAPRWLPLRDFVQRVIEAAYAFRHHKSALATACALSFTGHVLLACMFAAAGRIVLPDAPVLVVCMLALLGMFANALPLTPGGLGVGESAFQGLFALAGFSGGAPLMLSWRMGMAIQCVIGCLLYIRGVRNPEAANAAQSV
jgi:glycosyltransferase 2 family protein